MEFDVQYFNNALVVAIPLSRKEMLHCLGMRNVSEYWYMFNDDPDAPIFFYFYDSSRSPLSYGEDWYDLYFPCRVEIVDNDVYFYETGDDDDY